MKKQTTDYRKNIQQYQLLGQPMQLLNRFDLQHIEQDVIPLVIPI